MLGRGQDDDGTKPQQPQATQSGQAFHQLVLPKGHKDMILSLIAQHYRDKESAEGDSEQVDIIRGKGTNAIIKTSYHRELASKGSAQHLSTKSSNILAGKGLIFLLHGAPGVGKTSTAGEALSLCQSLSRSRSCLLMLLQQRALQNCSKSRCSKSHVVRSPPCALEELFSSGRRPS